LAGAPPLSPLFLVTASKQSASRGRPRRRPPAPGTSRARARAPDAPSGPISLEFSLFSPGARLAMGSLTDAPERDALPRGRHFNRGRDRDEFQITSRGADGASTPSGTVHATIGPQGGELVGPSGSAVDGVHLVIPAGALSADTEIT